MIGALWTGISGLSSQQKALDNESNNIANVNTIGYKASRLSFADQMYQDRIGKGVSVQEAEKIYTQGNLKSTGVEYDMALNGDGFFVVKSTKNYSSNELLYTRAGNFRMGENGTLQDINGNEIQGWAMSPIDQATEVITTNSNIKMFDNNYSKLISSTIIKNTTDITTITTKATDYTQTAKGDNALVFSGYGLKSQSAKISDIEALISNYNKYADALKSNPNEKSASSISQVSGINLPSSTDIGAVTKEGDMVYVYVDGNKISQEFDTDYETTMKKFADKISNIQGLKAYVADNVFDKGTSFSSSGNIRIESLIPGQIFNITEVGMVSSTVTTKGSVSTITQAQEGLGLGALQSAREALEKAISGKQYDVYDASSLNINAGISDYDLNIEVFDKDLAKNINLPTLTFLDVNSIDDIVSTINSDPNYSNYVMVENVNNNLVIKTLNSNFEVDFKSSITDTTSGLNLLEKNQDLSGVEGGGAEFLEIKTNIDQTSTKQSLQLRLDNLKISDSAFGEFSVDSTGLITMKQDGAEIAIGQVAIAVFNNNQGLNPIGDNLLQKTINSGEPNYSINNNKTAKIESQTLELSTADLSESLVNLMVFQRAFEANAKSITTSDELLQTLINLKR